MDGADRVDDRTFRVNFSDDGVARLRERVREKLKEFMRDYTDDTLVEYVIVLLRNGKRKEEARNDLDVFLEDDSDSFVTWLWDHLSSDLDLYLQPQEPYPDDMPSDQGKINDTHPLESASDKEKSNNLLKRRRNREWKGLVTNAAEPPPLRSSDTDIIHAEEKPHRSFSRGKKSLSPRPSFQRKRSRPDERQPPKKEGTSQESLNAHRRLFQFAVRDAVATSRPANSANEPKFKRLRSVVSTSTEDSSFDSRPQRIESVARVPDTSTIAIKAAAEAAEDVLKGRSSGNVFDRLGRGVDASEPRDRVTESRPELIHTNYLQRTDYTDTSLLESETGLASDSASDNEGYDDVNVMGHRLMDVSQTGTSGGNMGEEDSMTVQYSVAKNADEITPKKWINNQDQPSGVANNSRKIVNISVNVNTWKPPHYQAPREVASVDNRNPVEESEVNIGKSGVCPMKENNSPVSNGNAKPAADAQRTPQKTLPSTPGSYATGRPLEDADSRTIFVNNVHFAATKDSLSRHFNKFGEVLKVVIVTDAATGQPKGSAYVEFMRKEAAEHALSLDGTSFMSRILKVVKRSSAHQEATPVMTWPRMGRGSPFSGGRFSRGPFPRGIAGAGFRPRGLPIKPGARSMQWKRDGPAEGSAALVPSPITPRSLTYVRAEQPKPDGSSGTS